MEGNLRLVFIFFLQHFCLLLALCLVFEIRVIELILALWLMHFYIMDLRSDPLSDLFSLCLVVILFFCHNYGYKLIKLISTSIIK